MFGIKKRIDQIEYRLARIDKMLEDMRTVPKQVPSVVVHKPRLKQANKYPDKMVAYITGRYRTKEEIASHLNATTQSVSTYLKHMRKAGLQVKTRGRAPTEYKIYNPHKGANSNG